MASPEVKPEMLRWARERAGFELPQLTKRFPSLSRWERGERRPTLKSLQRFARAVYVPLETLLLPRPPSERVSIPDARRHGNPRRRRPSPDLLEMLEVCQARQAWYRDWALARGEGARELGGSLKPGADPIAAAAQIRSALGLSLETQRKPSTWVDGLRRLTERVENLGILVMSSSVVLNNNRRRLRPEEFRGFALADSVAPLVFVNAAETKAAQMFTLAHALAHLWRGESALCDAEVTDVLEAELDGQPADEQWCSRVGFEILVPLEAFQAELKPQVELSEQLMRLTRRFKVSPLVVLARLHHAGLLDGEELQSRVETEVARLRAVPKGRGGNFYLSLGVRVSKRFARALVGSASDGRATPADALRLLGLRKADTLHGFGQRLGVTP